MADVPPTIVVVHPKENRAKCSMEPLRGRLDFVFWEFPVADEQRGPLSDYVRLDLHGPRLGPVDHEKGLLILDGTWRLAARMRDEFLDVPPRSLPPWRTAYPRWSKLTVDPAEGLATIEALYLAHLVLGRPTAGLLDHYRWRCEFLALNGDAPR